MLRLVFIFALVTRNISGFYLPNHNPVGPAGSLVNNIHSTKSATSRTSAQYFLHPPFKRRFDQSAWSRTYNLYSAPSSEVGEVKRRRIVNPIRPALKGITGFSLTALRQTLRTLTGLSLSKVRRIYSILESRQSRITAQSQGNRKAISRQSQGNRKTISRQSQDNLKANARQSHDKISRQSHGNLNTFEISIDP